MPRSTQMAPARIRPAFHVSPARCANEQRVGVLDSRAGVEVRAPCSIKRSTLFDFAGNRRHLLSARYKRRAPRSPIMMAGALYLPLDQLLA